MITSFAQTVRDPGSRLALIVDGDDPELEAYSAIVSEWSASGLRVEAVVVPPEGSMGKALQRAGTDPVVLGDSTSVGMVGDDNRFRTPGWDLVMDGWLTEHRGIGYGDDGFQHERLPTAWWVSRPIVDVFGIVYPALRHYYMDNWWLEMGRGADCLRYFGEISIEHLHPLAEKAEDDAIYVRGRINGRNDKVTFQSWMVTARRRHVERLRAIVRAGQPRRVLADWHHPALWESLERLFTDRFGWELYAMGGLEWQQHGWGIPQSELIGWQPSDYLEPPGTIWTATHLEAHGAEYPERTRKLVTWEQAQALGGWDFVLGSVSAHQRPFSALARKLGARFVHQVGNARHAIDRMTPQLILASAHAGPLGPGQRQVLYHQEFDLSLFGPRMPAPDPFVVTSLMLRLEATSGPFAWLAEAPGITWQAPGGRNPHADTYVSPMSRVAELMAGSGWIWHDKLIGDGYGHVLWTAAAMGRPLIGHASHYRGLAGEPLWDDLNTAIDLDRHSPVDALRLIRAISGNPEWYGDMVGRTQAKFAELVDFDAEAEAIRHLLE